MSETEKIAELQEIVARLSRLVENSVTLNSTLDLDRLLQLIIDSAAELLDSDGASILLVDENTQDLYFAASTGSEPEELKKINVPLEGSIAGTIYREERPIIIHDVEQDTRHYREVGEKIKLQTRSLIGVPLRIQDRITGVLEAINKKEGAFDETDAEILADIAAQAAVAIHNARLVDALQKAYDELGKVEKLKSDFIAIASHELRTPLSVILGYAGILKEEAGEGTSGHAEAVLQSAMQMRSLIEDMTNMNMLRIGSAEMAFARTPLQSVVQEAFEEVVGLIEAKGQSIALTLPDHELFAMVDAPKLTMALTNLLNNAMRFTPAEGNILVELQRRGSEAWISVQDDGIGIPQDQISWIFDQFYQVESHMTRSHGGLGLGLAIVRAVVEAHQGRVWAESGGEDAGAKFTVALPLEENSS
jgi:signal transduction histidine kinase